MSEDLADMTGMFLWIMNKNQDVIQVNEGITVEVSEDIIHQCLGH